MKPEGLLERNPRILVIDDNPAIHDDLKKILLGSGSAITALAVDESILFDKLTPPPAPGFDVESAYQGQEGLGLVERRVADGLPYAMAFVDVRMPPGWDGIETISRLWQADLHLQIVICTAYSDYSWADIRTKLGSSESLLILKKPFDNIEVIQLAHALTRKWLVSRQAQIKLGDLDALVALRTRELRTANDALAQEFSIRAKAEEAFRLMFAASPIAIALLDQDLNFVDANAAMQRLHALSHEKLLEMRLPDLAWFSSESEARQKFSLAGNTVIDQQEITVMGAALNNRTALLWARPVEVHGAPRIICFVLDITQRKFMESKLRQAQLDAEEAVRAKSEFLANMSHEIRTPLHGVLGLCALLNDESLPDRFRTMAKLIQTSGEVLCHIVDDILDFSKIESGKLELEAENFDVTESLSWSIDIFQTAAREKKLDLHLAIDAKVPRLVVGDVTRIQQVLTNLISNAIKFTSHGSVKVEAQLVSRKGRQLATRTDECVLCFTVTDSGIGIPPEKLEHIFDSFSQVDASTTRRFGGTGLGLAISRKLVQAMGGEMKVNSTLGAGSAFSFTARFAVAGKESGKDCVRPLVETSTKRILVVEDNPINQIVTKHLLQHMGHSPTVVSDGRSALTEVQASAYDLVLMDLHMPDLDGREVTRQIRNLSAACAQVPIIALTASATLQDRRECLAVGMNDYLTKPFTVDALASVLRRWTIVATSAEVLPG